MATDITVTVNPLPTTNVTVGVASLPSHGNTHAPSGSDSLAQYYYPASNPSGFLTSGDIASQQSIVFVTGDQDISGVKNFFSRPTVNGTGILLSGEVAAAQTGYLTGYVQVGQTGAFLTTGAGDLRYVNVTGDTIQGNLIVAGNTSGRSFSLNTGGYVDFQTGVPSWKEGRLFYDDDHHTLSYYNDASGVSINIGQENVVRVSNGETGTIFNGQVVYISGAQGNRPKAFLADASSSSSSWEKTIGVATHDIVNQGYVTTLGIVHDLNTSSFNEGDNIYLSLTPGEFGTGIPATPNRRVQIGTVLYSHANQGRILVSIDKGSAIGNLQDVKTSNYNDNDALLFNGSSGYWEGRSLYNQYVSLTGTQEISGAKNFSTRPTVNGTGVLLSGEAQAASTGYLTGYVSKTETGVFYPSSNPSGFITGVDLSAYVTGSVVRPSETGNFITSSQTGIFYPISNPSGYITGVDLSSYATTAYVTGASGHLQNQVNSLNNQTGSYVLTGQTGQFYPSNNPSGFITVVDLSGYVTGSVVRPSETGSFITQSQTGAFYPASNPSGFITGGGSGTPLTVSFNRWSYTGDGSGVMYPISGAVSTLEGSYIVTLDSLLQDTSSYTIDQPNEDLIFGSAPPSGAKIVILEQTFTGGYLIQNYGPTNLSIPSAQLIPKSTSGCGVDSIETSVYDQNYDLCTFADGSKQYADFTITMPNNYDGGEVKAKFHWYAPTGSGTVCWGMYGVAVGDGDSLDVAGGTPQTVIDTISATGQQLDSDYTSYITIAGTPAAGKRTQFTIFRDPTLDTYSSTANLIGVEIEYNNGTTGPVLATLRADASDFIPTTTSGCGVDSQETATHDINRDYLTFADAVDSSAMYWFNWPVGWNSAKTSFFWNSTTGTGSVVWSASMRVFSDGDALDSALGTAQTVTDAVASANTLRQSSSTAAIVPVGTIGAGKRTVLKISRLASSNVSDDMAATAYLEGVLIEKAS